MVRRTLPHALKWLMLISSSYALAQSSPIDVANSKLIVHVSKAGLFSAFGDNHEVAAPISAGSVDEGAKKVTFIIDAARLRALDPHLGADKREQVQQRMLGPDVLDVSRYPHIGFESTTVTRTNDGWNVDGQLSLHGHTRPILLNVREEKGHYIGACTIKQRDFGITPVSVGGGAVRVKDELKIDFDIVTKSAK
jgi:polyisoprenoid-binding protein YceI